MAEPELRGTTGLSRRHHRHGPVKEGLTFPSRFVSGRMSAEAAVPTVLPRPFGDLGQAAPARLARLAEETWEGASVTRRQRGEAVRVVLEYLCGFAGATWQERWDTSPLGRGEFSASELGSRRTSGVAVTPGIRALLCLRAIQPSLLAFRRQSFNGYSPFFIAAQSDSLLDKYAEHVRTHDMSWAHRSEAVFDLVTLLTVQGVAMADVTAASLLHHAHQMREVMCLLRPGKQDANRFAGIAAWNVLHRMGHFPPGTPATMRAALVRGQVGVEEMIDQYPISNRSVRQLLVDYCLRRSADADYASLSHLVVDLARNFWAKIEQINPGQPDLRIAPEVYAAWRQAITLRDDGKPRVGQDKLVIAVRSFYFDLHTWAAEEPERWGPWVAPCPVPPSELRGLGKRRRRVNERSAARTQQRQPLLRILVEHVESRYDHTRTLLERASRAADGEAFLHDGRSYRRIVTASDRHNAVKIARNGQTPPVRVVDEATGEIVHIVAEEEAAFWDWACVETLRHSGVRIEELCELTHLSIRHYQRANGEVIALLVIAPSKTDRERVIPMSAELFHVIASVIRRHTRDGRTIPLVSRLDTHDKLWSAPLPFLFQRQIGASRAVISTTTVQHMLKRRCEALAETHPAFRTTTFTPHDFRRIFATELVNGGLPIHIGAALLGHLNVQTTRGYVAVFDEDVVRHYTTYLAERRQTRPSDEYRDPAPQEMQEFEEHFEKRKVELGSCGRPYGTPCQHEHACIRCPMLHVNPKMLARLDELEADLTARRNRAQAEGWLGETGGIDLTLSLLRAKRAETQRRARRPPVDLGIPSPRGQRA